MMFKVLLIASIAYAAAEAPFAQHHKAPYAPAGFRPDIPFNLPGEYLPPTSFDDDTAAEQQYADNQGYQFEISKQRVDFAGQEVQYVPVSEPHRQYGPPPSNQQPGTNTNGGGGVRPNRRPFNRRPSFPGNRGQPNFPQQPQAGSFNPPQRLPNPQTDERFEPQQIPHQQPAAQYGAPINVDPRSQAAYDHHEDEDAKHFALDALNAAIENYNRLQENHSDRISQGQYFVVNPDQSIQKVQFTTKQSEAEAKDNDFTAQLKYTKVGELHDPLYKYNAAGQLVRIVKK
ncbi:uncharacterized protein [Musca autumnalis]|uniref:uncharacterized protein n=1 Tax=Musca autumnalis TaxID=221902 RepID=UPI003CF1031B